MYHPEAVAREKAAARRRGSAVFTGKVILLTLGALAVAASVESFGAALDGAFGAGFAGLALDWFFVAVAVAVILLFPKLNGSWRNGAWLIGAAAATGLAALSHEMLGDASLLEKVKDPLFAGVLAVAANRMWSARQARRAAAEDGK